MAQRLLVEVESVNTESLLRAQNSGLTLPSLVAHQEKFGLINAMLQKVR